MGYEINVSLNGKHFFATHERSISTRSQLDSAMLIFRQKFPEIEGYKIDVSRWEKVGTRIEV